MDYYDDEDPRPEPEWIYFTDPDHRLARFCIVVAALAIAGWLLIRALST